MCNNIMHVVVYSNGRYIVNTYFNVPDCVYRRHSPHAFSINTPLVNEPHIMDFKYAFEFLFSTRPGLSPSNPSCPVMILLSSKKSYISSSQLTIVSPPDTTQAVSVNLFPL